MTRNAQNPKTQGQIMSSVVDTATNLQHDDYFAYASNHAGPDEMIAFVLHLAYTQLTALSNRQGYPAQNWYM
jgi:hypothetical protein